MDETLVVETPLGTSEPPMQALAGVLAQGKSDIGSGAPPLAAVAGAGHDGCQCQCMPIPEVQMKDAHSRASESRMTEGGEA